MKVILSPFITAGVVDNDRRFTTGDVVRRKHATGNDDNEDSDIVTFAIHTLHSTYWNLPSLRKLIATSSRSI